MRRSTVLSLPHKLVFPALSLIVNSKEKKCLTTKLYAGQSNGFRRKITAPSVVLNAHNFYASIGPKTISLFTAVKIPQKSFGC